MPIFADWTPQDWIMLSVGLCFFVERIGAWRLTYIRDRAKLARDIAVAEKVEEVAVKAEQAATKVEEVKSTLVGHNAQLGTLTEAVHEVHVATNSLVDRLVNATTTVALEAGRVAGRAEEKASSEPNKG